MNDKEFTDLLKSIRQTRDTRKNQEERRCPCCKRMIPNNKFYTKSACRWCDADYNRRKK